MASNLNINPALLDSDQILMLIETGEDSAAELLQELLELYESECEVKLSELRVAINRGESLSASKLAHAIAGSSANIGARKIWQMAKHVEETSKAGNSDSCASTVDELDQLYALTIKELRGIIRDLSEI